MSDYDDEEEDRPVFGGRGLGAGKGLGMASNSGLGRHDWDGASGGDNPNKRPRLQQPGGGKGRGGSSFAAKMMAQMGWVEGQGLGAQGRGRLAPIETQLRPQGAGLGAVKEKTKQAKEEEKRAAAFRGEVVDDSSEEERKRRKKAKDARRLATASGTPSGTATPRGTGVRRKAKITTLEQIHADLQGLEIPPNVLESAFALTGEGIQPLAAVGGFVSSQTPNVPSETEASKASKRINLELVACAESRHGLNDKKEHLEEATSHLIEGIDLEKREIAQTQDLINIITGLEEVGLGEDDNNRDSHVWEDITHKFEAIEIDFKEDLDKFDLHEVAVAVIHPHFRAAMLEWKPLERPDYLVSYLDRIRHVLGIESNTGTDALALKTDFQSGRLRNRKATTPYETMIYTLWLPRVRSAITNEWQVENPTPLTVLFEKWRPILPMFIYSNLVNDLLVPRLVKALATWKPARPSKRHLAQILSPDALLFPWLPFLPDRHLDPNASDGILAEVKRKLRHVLSSHSLESGPPEYMIPWKGLLGPTYLHILTTRLLPRLASYLSKNLEINPSDQDTVPLTTVLMYTSLFPATTMAQLLAAEFFPKFHDVLHLWLTTTPNYSEIEAWYTWWKGEIPAHIRDIPPLDAEWTAAFTRMGLAMDLGERAATELPAPTPHSASRNTTGPPYAAAATGAVASSAASTPVKARPEPVAEQTFRDVVDDWCTENDLFLIALREAHERTGAPLFRITANTDQKGGVIAYIRGDVLWVRSRKDRKVFEPVGLGEDLVNRASAR